MSENVTKAVVSFWLLAGAGGLLTAAPARAADRPAAPTTQAATEPGAAPDDDGVGDIELMKMEVPTVITGTRHRQAIASAPYAVSVLTAKDIRDAGSRTISDALRLVPGMDVAEIGYNIPAISARGMNRYLSNHVLVLVDGRQIYDSMFGGTEWIAWPIQLEDIGRIEVIRGSGGVTWGTNAVNGIINIVSKKPADQVGLTTTSSGGSRGTAKEHLGYAFADQKLQFRLSGEYERSDGFERGGSFLFPYDAENHTGRMTLHALYEAGPRDHFTVSGGSGIVSGGISPSPFSGYRLQRPTDLQSNYLMAKWSHDVAFDNTINLTAYVNDLYFTQGLLDSEFRYQQFALQLGHTFKPSESDTLTWGIDTRAEYLVAATADPYMLSEGYLGTGLLGAYVQNDWQFAPKWALSLGGRIDYEFYGGFQPSGRVALSYEPARDSLIYAAVSRAFMYPTVGDRFQNEPILANLGRLTSHAGMNATDALIYELGYRGKFFDKWETTLDAYWNEYNAWPTAELRPGPPSLFRLDYDARAGASVYGLEFGNKYAVTKNLTLLGNYTFERLNWRGSMDPTMEGDINTPPEHKFMLGARYSPLDDLHLSSHLYYVDSIHAPNSTMPFLARHVPTYFRLDLRAEYEFWKKQASVAVGVRNLLQENHYEGGSLFLNDGAVPRMIYAEFRMTIK